MTRSANPRDTPSHESQQIFVPGCFAGAAAIVTGGGSGIGLATAKELARLGAKVAICGRTEDKLVAAAAELAVICGSDGSDGSNGVHYATCDIREPDAIEAFVGSVKEKFGAITILVNNAGGQFPAPAEMISPNGFAAVVRNNLLGTFNMTSAVAKTAMIPDGGGRIINIIANIYRGFPGMAHTGAARAGVENLTMSLSVEWARYGICVNAVAPGIITSTGTKQYPPQILADAVASCPMGRAGTVDEVAASILFLASPAAQYITGATLRIDGAHSLSGDLFPIPKKK